MVEQAQAGRDLRVFQRIAADDQDRLIFVNSRKDGKLGAFRNSTYRRAVLWLRDRVGLSRSKDFGQTYDRFLNALRNSQHRFDPDKMQRTQSELQKAQSAGRPLTTRTVQQVFRNLDTSELSPNAFADANAIRHSSAEVDAVLARAEGALGPAASDGEFAQASSELRAAHRLLRVMQARVLHLETDLRAAGEIVSADAGLVRSLRERLARQHQRLADLATEHDIDVSASTSAAGRAELARSGAGYDAARVYEPTSALVDRDHISEAEVEDIMPHLLSDWVAGPTAGKGAEVQRADILHAKYTFLEHQGRLAARGEGLTTSELEGINQYIETPEINKHLGRNLGDPSRLRGALRRQYDDMQSGLAKLPDERGVAYRGETTSTQAIDRFRGAVGSLFAATAFVSTSAAPNFAKEFTRPGGIRNQAHTECELRTEIIGRTGKNIAGIPDVADGATDPTEYLGNGEILFRPGTNFRLVAFAKHPDKEVYAMVLKEETEAPPNIEPLRNLKGAGIIGKAGTVVDGLAHELAQLWDERTADS